MEAPRRRSRARTVLGGLRRQLGEAREALGPAEGIVDGARRLGIHALTKLVLRLVPPEPPAVGEPPDAEESQEAPLEPPPPPQLTLKQRFQALLDRSLEPPEAGPIDHPAFGRILEQLVPDEALIVSLLAKRGRLPFLEVRAGTRLGRGGKMVTEHFSAIGETVGARHPERVPAYVDNLCRMGLVRLAEADPDDRDVYELLEGSPELDAIRERITGEMKLTPKLQRRMAELTAWGRSFCEVCSA